MERRNILDLVRGQEVVRLTGGATVREAARLMQARNVGSVLVMEKERLAGIFTERDIVQRVVAAGRDPEDTRLAAVMTAKPDTVAPDTTALDALRLMHDGGYRHLPVVEGERVLGVVSRRDFLGAEKARLEDEIAVWEQIG